MLLELKTAVQECVRFGWLVFRQLVLQAAILLKAAPQGYVIIIATALLKSWESLHLDD